jgi:hypothetical protein
MVVMVQRLVFVSLFVAATAYAQAPGETEVGAAPGAPGMVAPNPCGYGWQPTLHNVMADRWAVGLSVGSLGIGPKDAMADQQANFGIGQLSLRFRATPHLELEGAFGGGHDKLSDGTDGGHEVNTGALGLRYRFRPYSDWNWWLMGGLGAISITDQGATKPERKAAKRPMGELGIGLERRFNHFALQAELRALSAGPRKDGAGGPPPPQVMNAGAPAGMVPPPPPQGPVGPEDKLAGGMFTIGASYYF